MSIYFDRVPDLFRSLTPEERIKDMYGSPISISEAFLDLMIIYIDERKVTGIEYVGDDNFGFYEYLFKVSDFKTRKLDEPVRIHPLLYVELNKDKGGYSVYALGDFKDRITNWKVERFARRNNEDMIELMHKERETYIQWKNESDLSGK